MISFMKYQMHFRWVPLLVALFFAGAAHAHHLPPGFETVDEFEHKSLLISFLHPFTGLDHLAAALAAGCLAFAAGKRSGRVLASCFMASLATGIVLGRYGLALPMLEQGLAISVIAAGVLLAVNRGDHLGNVILALIGFWHGNAHGVEMNSIISGLGLFLGTLAAMLAGSGMAWMIFPRFSSGMRFAGGAAVVAGLFMCLSRFA